MIDYSGQLSSAGERLTSSQLGVRLPHLGALWRSRELWVEHDDQLVNADAALSHDGRRINLYPSLTVCPTSQHELAREFGLYVLARGANEAKAVWENRATKAEPGVVSAFQLKLKSGTFASYRDIVEDFKTAVDRFTALNIANALIANRVPFADSAQIELVKWGPTCEYAEGRRRHPIDALLGAYCPARMTSCFGEAFADAVLNELRSVRESSTAAELRKLVEEVAELSR